MRLLLDTNVCLWALYLTRKLSKTTQELIADPNNDVWVSVASVWEVAIKKSTGKLRFSSMGLVEAADQFPFTILDITARHALEIEKLPLIHADPFDRMVIAQARVERLTVVTADYRFGDYDCDPIFV